MESLTDGWGREIKSVRVSVTDKCNFRCRYCMPAEGLEWLGRDELLSFEELERVVRVLAGMGVEEVRLTGGEPLARRDLPTLVSMLSPIPGVTDLSLTTNGVLLDRYAGPLVEAGLRRLNVSLDSLSHVRFAEITRRDALDRVLAGLEAAEQHAELRPIKVNCVAIRGFTEEEVPALAELARRKPYVVRFIEFMPLDADERWDADDVVKRLVQTFVGFGGHSDRGGAAELVDEEAAPPRSPRSGAPVTAAVKSSSNAVGSRMCSGEGSARKYSSMSSKSSTRIPARRATCSGELVGFEGHDQLLGDELVAHQFRSATGSWVMITSPV